MCKYLCKYLLLLVSLANCCAISRPAKGVCSEESDSHDDGLKELLLKLCLRAYLLIAAGCAERDNNKLVVIIVHSVNNGDALSLELTHWLVQAQDISVQELTVRSNDARHKAVIDFIDKLVLWMLRSQRPVYLDFDRLSNEATSIHSVNAWLEPGQRGGLKPC